MNTWKLIVGFVICCCTGSVSAQQANFVQAEKFRQINAEIGSLNVIPNFLKDSDKFWYSYKTGEGTKYYFVDPAKREKRYLFENEYLAEELTKLTAKPYNYRQLP